MNANTPRPLRRSAAPLLLLAAVALLASACGDHGHADVGVIELQSRGAVPQTFAVWTEDDGWTDAEGNAITEISNIVDIEGMDGLQPLRAGGPNASFSVIVTERDGNVLPMSTESRDDVTRERECSEYSVRYQPDDNTTNVIAWPAIAHPDSTLSRPATLFAERDNGDLVGIFHCDHLHIYPEEAGTVDLRILTWHINHADDRTDALRIRVLEAASSMESDSHEHESDSHEHESDSHAGHDHD